MSRASLRRAASLALALLTILALTGPAAAIGTLDQAQTSKTTLYAVGGSTTIAMAQTFTAGASGQLDTVRLHPDRDLNGWTVSIRTVSAGQPTATVLASKTLSVSNARGWMQVAFAAPATVSAGSQYAIVVGGSSASSLSMNGLGSLVDPYVGGQGFFSVTAGATWDPFSTNSDLAFETYVTADTDADDDGVANADDVCADTVLPESAPVAWGKNRYSANAAGDFVDGKGKDSGLGVADTGGCSGDQIIAAAALGAGHTKNGISRDALEQWIAAH